MIDLNTKLARTAWELGPISKTLIPDHILNELIQDFVVRQGVSLKSVEKLEELNTYTVVIDAEECLELYSDWMGTFEEHGYEAPFLVFDNCTTSE